jgi:hypothetical protein
MQEIDPRIDSKFVIRKIKYPYLGRLELGAAKSVITLFQ